MMKNIVELGYIYTPDKVKQPVQVKISEGKEALKSVMCDVIKIRLKRRDERRSGKGNPQKKMKIPHF